jgi:hypothetical protein
MRTDRRNRCDQIIELIDRCLAESEPTASGPEDAASTREAAWARP